MPEGQGFVHGTNGRLIAVKRLGKIHVVRVQDAPPGAPKAYVVHVNRRAYYFDIDSDQTPGFVELTPGDRSSHPPSSSSTSRPSALP